METNKYENVTIYIIDEDIADADLYEVELQAFPVHKKVTIYFDPSNHGYYYMDNSFKSYIYADEGDLYYSYVGEDPYAEENPDDYEVYVWVQDQNKHMLEDAIKKYAQIEYDRAMRQIARLTRKTKLYKRYLED